MPYPNWFVAGGAQWYFEKHLLELKDRKSSFLQIGAYTGDASTWLFENVLTHEESNLTDVDTWQGSDEADHKNLDWDSVEQVYDSRTNHYIQSGKLVKFKGTSDSFFESSDYKQQKYDFIYIDGDHAALSVLKDGIHALDFLAPGGLLAFDDYLWRSGRGQTYDPSTAIDAIIVALGDRYTLIDKGVQVWLKSNVQ